MHLQHAILSWYRKNGRDLPWRRTRDPYVILVSEIMLQQTQISRVIPKYRAFLKRFPNFRSLARARLGSVLKLWSGLGYNRRARALHLLARRIVAERGGRLPRDFAQLRALPGIGQYTAGAVLNFAFHIDTPILDTNIRRIFSRLFPNEKDLLSLAGKILPKNKGNAWHHALMDFGSLVCIGKKPKCTSCFLQRSCPSAFRTKKLFKQSSLQKPFIGSNRYYRGRILSFLSHSPLQRGISLPQLKEYLHTLPAPPSPHMLRRLLVALCQEGLLVHTKNRLFLPR